MLLEAPVPAVSCAEAEAVVREHFGVAARATFLPGERDSNFRMDCADGATLLLKISNASEDPAVTNLQTEALRYLLIRRPDLPVPRLIASREGEVELLLAYGSVRHITRLMTFLPGRSAAAMAGSPNLRRSVAHSLAALDDALREFKHPATRYELLWDVSHAERVRPMVDSIAPSEERSCVVATLDDFDSHVAARLPSLRSQVIHNDFNPQNILICEHGPRVTGIIDFGDLLEGPLISDLATAAAYQALGADEPVRAIIELAGWFHEIMPLEPAELEVLSDLTAARLAMIVAISHWRVSLHPQNRAYILRNTASAARCLASLRAFPRSRARDLLGRACGVR